MLFLMFFKGFIVKIRTIPTLSARSSFSPRALIFLISPLQSLQTTFSIYVYILKISSKILFILHTIWTVSSVFFEVTECELFSEIFFENLGEIRGDKSRKISRCFSSHQKLSLNPSLSLISDLLLSLLISPYLQVRTDGYWFDLNQNDFLFVSGNWFHQYWQAISVLFLEQNMNSYICCNEALKYYQWNWF